MAAPVAAAGPGLTGNGGAGGAGKGGALYNTNGAFAFVTGSTFSLNASKAGDSADAGSRYS